MHDSRHEQSSRWRQAQGQEEQSGEEAGPEPESSGQRGSGDSDEQEGGNYPDGEENEGNWKFIQGISEGSDVEMEQTLQIYRTAGREP